MLSVVATPRLEYMPDAVIDRIAELLLFRTALERQAADQLGMNSLRFEVGHLAVMHLALAAPNLYAPCLRAVIRNVTRFHMEPILQYYELRQLADVVPAWCRELVVSRSINGIMFPASLAKLHLAHSSLTGIKSFMVLGCSPALLACMVAVLPRTGMRELEVVTDVKGEEDMLACSMSLAQAWPTSVDCLHVTLVNTLRLQRLVSATERMPMIVAHLPLATRSLHAKFASLSLDVPTFRQIPLAPTLTKLTLHGSHNTVNMVGLERLMTRLPSSLIDLSLISWPFGGTTTAAGIGWNLPQQLEALRLFSCDLTDDDLAEFELPPSLRHLDLESNKLCAVPVNLWPAHLLTLVLKGTAVTDKQLEWVASLPTSLRVLNVDHTTVGDQFARALLQWMPAPRRTSRMTLHVAETKVSKSAKTQLSTKLNVFDVN
ncbi:hypothetical protein GGF32_005811 [Allomyces javanicus]|nr:hypothetical protein GGF32_005811 [Allomyces javanicus]